MEIRIFLSTGILKHRLGTKIPESASRRLPSYICEAERIVVHIRIPIVALAIIGVGHNHIRCHELTDRGVVEAGIEIDQALGGHFFLVSETLSRAGSDCATVGSAAIGIALLAPRIKRQSLHYIAALVGYDRH